MTRLDDASAGPEILLRVAAAPWGLVRDDLDSRIGLWRVLDANNALVMTTASVEHASLAVYAVNELAKRERPKSAF